jgi:hypothetical protein
VVVNERAQHFRSDITKQVRKQNDVRDDCTQDKMGDDQLVGSGERDGRLIYVYERAATEKAVQL